MEAGGTQEAPEGGGAAQVQAYASFGRRLAAYLLDLPIAFLAVTIPVYIIMRFLRATGAWSPAGDDPQYTWSMSEFGAKLSIMIGFFLSTGPLYGILFHASPWEATFGKRLMNIHVSGSGGQRIGIGRSIGRSASLFLLGVFWLNLVSAVMIVVTQKRKGLHDLVAGTQVLAGRLEGVLEPWRIIVAVALPVAWLVFTLLVTM